LKKIHPISLGLSAARVRNAGGGDSDKTTDIFWAGRLSNAWRRRGLQQLERLRADGIRVDIAAETLPHDAFMRRCARAWLVWSPEGLGWDCFRHYEAAACFSVPLISQPSIERHRPLRHGEHALYYDVEGDSLSHTIRAALADTRRLRAIAQAGRAHVLAHHTEPALCRYIAETVLSHAPET
jgi:hypothetical protein